MKIRLTPILLILWLALVWACQPEEFISINKWEKLTLSFEGLATSEGAAENPFTDYRLMVHFTNGTKSYDVPGFYAADGNAAETSATQGNIWQVRFRPDMEGEWNYQVSFRKGDQIAISDDPEAGEAVAFDGESGSFVVNPIPEDAKGFHALGKLQYVNQRYLQFAETGDYYIKGGADSPENFLGYADFDSTYVIGQPVERSGEAKPQKQLHRYQPHLQDWQEGDPSWQDGKGKSMIGALNYLADKGMNSVYFLTMNIEGDGKDVWPYTHHEERKRFDVSKLDQWEIIFDHMDNLGLMLHVVTQETENELLLDNGDTGPERKLYYRELIARFGHHLAVTWNMGEENGPANFTPNAQNTQQQKDMVEYMKTHDPYQNFVVIHTHANPKHRYELFEKLLGFEYLDGPSIQIGNRMSAHSETKAWLHKSDSAGKQWVVNIDEIGPAHQGVDPDSKANNNQDSVRHYVLWGNLMAGGGGVEWYFGYRNPHNDLNLENWRSRDQVWDFTRHALDFFQNHLDFDQMENHDEMLSGEGYVFGQSGQKIAIYLPRANQAGLVNLAGEGDFQVQWYNPRQGGELMDGSITNVSGKGETALGLPPADPEKDWVALLTASANL
ncbi:MAG: DUF5060 domain-containing protein [Candidatus Cyclobacteriaceae bacterium M3_2C_046]